MALPGHDAPGIAGLDALLREHGGAIEADLQRFYGVPLSDLVTGRLSWRRLGVLLKHLPLESATVQATGGDAVAWSFDQHLLATLVDVERLALWQRAGGKGQRPERIVRPGEHRGNRIGHTDRPAVEVRALLARYRPRREAPWHEV